jgi:hypothetical protein
VKRNLRNKLDPKDPKRTVDQIIEKRKVDEKDNIEEIDRTREDLLSFIMPIWKNSLILKFFQTESTKKLTSLSDCKAPLAFNYMSNKIGSAIFNYIGFEDSQSYIVSSKKDDNIIKFPLPSEKGLFKSTYYSLKLYFNYFTLFIIFHQYYFTDYQELISRRIQDHFHNKRKKIHRADEGNDSDADDDNQLNNSTKPGKLRKR